MGVVGNDSAERTRRADESDAPRGGVFLSLEKRAVSPRPARTFAEGGTTTA